MLFALPTFLILRARSPHPLQDWPGLDARSLGEASWGSRPITLSCRKGVTKLTPLTSAQGYGLLWETMSFPAIATLWSLCPESSLLFQWSALHLWFHPLLPHPCPPTGCSHHCDAGEEAAALPVASLRDLRAQVRAGGPLVPAVSDHEDLWTVHPCEAMGTRVPGSARMTLLSILGIPNWTRRGSHHPLK